MFEDIDTDMEKIIFVTGGSVSANRTRRDLGLTLKDWFLIQHVCVVTIFDCVIDMFYLYMYIK